MKQSKIDSIIESALNIAIGAGIALAAQLIWFPLIGKDFSIEENLATTAFFTIVSFLRSYFVRRFCDGKTMFLALKLRFKL